MFKKISISFIVLFILLATSVVLIDSAISLYPQKEMIMDKLGREVANRQHPDRAEITNPLLQSLRQIPPDNIEDLEINDNAHLVGQWSAPFDWNVTAIHSVLLPDYSVMSFGSFAVAEKEDNKDLRENKKIILTDGRLVHRDKGASQWVHHDVNSSVDFDIWDLNKGYSESAHQIFLKPVLMDAFCSVVRVLDSERVFIMGGNENVLEGMPDTQSHTMIYNVKDRTFEKSKNLNFKRWYGSIIRTGDDKLVMVGGEDVITTELSTTPEIIDLNNIDDGWQLLDKANSYDLFGDHETNSWYYPRSYLASDGNIVGVSYNKIWVMDKSDDYRVRKTGEIPLVSGGIAKIIESVNPNSKKEYKHKLKLMTIGSPVGESSSSVMIEKDQVLFFGGKQLGDEYSPSNKVVKIDFSDSNSPKIEELGSMHNARKFGDATILPDGKVFLNGGHSYLDDLNFSNLIPELYDPKNSTSVELSGSYFRRNYHSTSLLIPDGTIFTAGGDVWNAEIFYPPYLFTKDWNNKTILAKRPEILDLDQDINRGELILSTSTSKNITKVTLISAGSKTHSQGSEPKFRTLEFSKLDNNQLSVQIPKNRDETQNGLYMIFLINDSGVPSIGKIVNLI
jgi:hypothetical protein